MNPTNDPFDDEIRGLLRELGRADERHAPSFQRVWRAAREAHEANHARGPSPHRRLAWTVVAAAALCAVILVAVNRPPAPLPATSGVEAEAGPLPTDFLLAANNDDPVERIAAEIRALLQP